MDKKTRINQKLLRLIRDDADKIDRHIQLLLRNNRNNQALKYWLGMYRKASTFNNSELSGAAMQKVKELLKV